ncbi:MAG: ABC transporter ATP-binding protein [Acetobacteraceae bacterium]|nr:ABC transporter ATP-binding protein [Acetobacteraceae bacterium]
MSAAGEPILEVDRLSAGYGRSQVLFDLSLTVPRTGIVAVLGRNGAGKTTLLKALAGEMYADGGEIRYDGARANEQPTERRARQGLGYVPQEDAIFGRLSVRENLLLGATGQGNERDIGEILDLFPRLSRHLGQTAATLSGGERKMLAIGRALLGKPRLLMLDEPTEGVWVGVIDEIARRLEELSTRIAVLLVEQHVTLALGVAQYAYVIDRGSVALKGPAGKIRDDPRLFRFLAP